MMIRYTSPVSVNRVAWCYTSMVKNQLFESECNSKLRCLRKIVGGIRVSISIVEETANAFSSDFDFFVKV